MKEFKGNKCECYSPAQRKFIADNGILHDKEYETTWTKEERIKYLQKKDIPYCADDIIDLKRRCWVYEGLERGSEKAEKLSSILIDWSMRNK